MLRFKTIECVEVGEGKEKRTYIRVDETTESKLKEAGLGARKVFIRQNAFNFLPMLAIDEKAMSIMKEKLNDAEGKPMLIDICSSIGDVLDRRQQYKAVLFGGQNWSGAVADVGEAWRVFVTNH